MSSGIRRIRRSRPMPPKATKPKPRDIAADYFSPEAILERRRERRDFCRRTVHALEVYLKGVFL